MVFGRVALKIEQREIVLIKFPFSDFTSTKIRPALVISNNDYNEKYMDIIVLALTSNLKYSENKINISNSDLESGKLPCNSAIRIDKPFAISKSRILKIQGKVGSSVYENIFSKLSDFFKLR
jgi:mRNA interferase MazF